MFLSGALSEKYSNYLFVFLTKIPSENIQTRSHTHTNTHTDTHVHTHTLSLSLKKSKALGLISFR